MVTTEEKQKIRLAIEARRDPQRGKSEVFLRFGGRSFKYLVKDGKPTSAGAYWSEISGNPLPTEGFGKAQDPIRRGRSEYIKFLDGTERLVRSWADVVGQM